MNISKNSAKQIVDEISKLVKQNINLMDETGHIIASRDKNRIGEFHEGAYKIITEGLEEYYITPENETKTTKQGLNLSLQLNGEIVGVVGITGSYDEVINFGKLIKKMTEILLLESSNSYQKLMDKRVRNSFLEEWIINNEYSNIKELEEKGKNIGIDIHKPRRIIILSIADIDNYKDTQRGQELIARIEGVLDSLLSLQPGNIHFRNASRQIILINNRTTKEMVKIAQNLSSYISQKENVEICIGIDSPQNDIHMSYINAHKAWRNAIDNNKSWVCYEDLSIELIINCASRERKIEFVSKVFSGIEENELRDYIALLNLYFKYNGSINLISQKLYIHKNTLQYRINKLYNLTGLDVRNIKDAAIFNIALIIIKELEN